MERNTSNLTISLPTGMKERIKRRVKDDHFGTPSDYLRSLVREDLRHRDEERLDYALLLGLQSGRGTEITSKTDWKKFWSKVDAHTTIRRGKKYA